MKQQTTFKKFGFIIVLLFGQLSISQIIYSNGNLSTGTIANNGNIAPTGYTLSECPNNTGNTTESNNSTGFSPFFNSEGTINFQLADNFIVPAGQQWNVTSFDFYAYQTGFTGTTIPHDQLRIEIYNIDPSIAGTTPIAGNMTSNVLNVLASGDALMYRLFNSTIPVAAATGITRKIYRLNGNLVTTLGPGEYWVKYQLHPTNNLGTFSPIVTVVGSRGAVGANSKQNVVASTAVGAVLGWTNLVDLGNPLAAQDYPQDLPFNVNGTITTLTIDSNNITSDFKMYPSPVKNICNFKNITEKTFEISDAKIYDLKGALILQTKLSNNIDTNLSINLSDLKTGTYIVKLLDIEGKNIYSNQLIKE
jgi:Secretion system C-terminal sorting domain